MRQWVESIPNNGMIRYYIAGNLERVLLTNPKSLSELLAHKVYEFPKPDIIIASLARVTGEHGLLLVEGDEHKVGSTVSEHRIILTWLETKKEPHAGVRIPTHQGNLPHLLDQKC